jgi:iron complex transport system ATP-binding protein
MRTDQVILQAQQLQVGYRHGAATSVVLEVPDLRVLTGELVCFMGPNGVGKSTLLRTLAGVQAPLHGQVMVGQYPLEALDAVERARKISLVLTERVQTGWLTVYDLVSMGRYPYTGWMGQLRAEDEAMVEAAIQQTHIESLLGRYVHELSDGQMQKVMIARALAQDGELMILDEPTAHLDLNNRVEIMHLLKQLARNTGKAIVMATHELDLALQMADRLWLAQPHAQLVEGMPEDLVLTGAIDQTFPLKGYDLKTGKVIPIITQKTTLCLQGQGYLYLWTKNALERNGWPVSSHQGVKISIIGTNESPLWAFEWQGTTHTYTSLETLLGSLLLQLSKI